MNDAKLLAHILTNPPTRTPDGMYTWCNYLGKCNRREFWHCLKAKTTWVIAYGTESGGSVTLGFKTYDQVHRKEGGIAPIDRCYIEAYGRAEQLNVLRHTVKLNEGNRK